MKIKVRSKFDEFLDKRGIKKAWLCDQVGCDRSQLSRWCQNDNNGVAISTPSVGYILKINKVLNCNLEDLYELIKESE
ncbi:helix-turn-helix domain-containing protein [Bacillus sp. SCS-151]|uniref:helix-turn-helix domain-containing protein n=1 Tax=Nanhaiella sioensis TaxID=3115293 RepID=UPI003979A16C